MKKFMDWMTNKFAPKMNKLARNPWIASVQDAILTAMPMIFIGSFTTILTAFGGLIQPSLWVCCPCTLPIWCLTCLWKRNGTIRQRRKQVWQVSVFS